MRCTINVTRCDNVICWQLPSNQSLWRQISGYGVGVGDHRVGWWWKGSWSNKIVQTLIRVHSTILLKLLIIIAWVRVIPPTMSCRYPAQLSGCWIKEPHHASLNDVQRGAKIWEENELGHCWGRRPLTALVSQLSVLIVCGVWTTYLVNVPWPSCVACNTCYCVSYRGWSPWDFQPQA